MPSPNLRPISRAKLYEVFKTDELVRLVEDILTALNDSLPADTTAVEDALDAHMADTSDAHQASAIGFTPTAVLLGNNVQAALAVLGSLALQAASSVNIMGGTIALASGSVGYAAGNGGAVTQATSKTTGVTLSKMSGDITLNGAALAAATTVSFTLTNANIAASDLVHAVHNSAGTNGAYGITAQVLAAGSTLISVRNLTAGSLSEAIMIRFAVFKAANT